MGLKSPIARRVTLSIFCAIVFIEIVILVPSYLRREDQLIGEVIEQILQLARIEFHTGDKPGVLSSPADIEEKAREILYGRYMLGVIVLQESTVIASVGDTNLMWKPDPATDSLSIHNIPMHHLPDERLAIYIEHTAHKLSNDLIIIADISHIPTAMTAYVNRIGGLVLLISVFVTGVTVFVLWLILLNPIIVLRNRMERSGKSLGDDTELPEHLINAQTEIGDLYRSFDKMLKTIHATIRETEDLARFPAENPSPIIRCSPLGAVMYANEATRRHPELFAPGFAPYVSDDLKAFVRKTTAFG